MLLYQILPHLLLDNYDISIWVDVNYLIRGDIVPLQDNYYKIIPWFSLNTQKIGVPFMKKQMPALN